MSKSVFCAYATDLCKICRNSSVQSVEHIRLITLAGWIHTSGYCIEKVATVLVLAAMKAGALL